MVFTRGEKERRAVWKWWHKWHCSNSFPVLCVTSHCVLTLPGTSPHLEMDWSQCPFAPLWQRGHCKRCPRNDMDPPVVRNSSQQHGVQWHHHSAVDTAIITSGWAGLHQENWASLSASLETWRSSPAFTFSWEPIVSPCATFLPCCPFHGQSWSRSWNHRITKGGKDLPRSSSPTLTQCHHVHH